MNMDYQKELPADLFKAAKVFECFSSEHCLKIMRLFGNDEEIATKDIAEIATIKRTAITHHIKRMVVAGVLSERKEGKFVFYKINEAAIKEAFGSMNKNIQCLFQ